MNRLLSKAFIIIMMLLSCASCKHESSKTASQVIKIEGLTLNNNEKWIANPETHIGMQRIDSILKNNPSSRGKTLGEALSKQTSYIIKSCNMKGEAHNQLHVVLIPVLEVIMDLKDTEDSTEVNKKRQTLQNLAATYFEYFKI